MRTLKYHEAIREAFDICLGEDPNTVLMGLGVPDPKGVFGTTLGLQEKHGAHRVMDMPCSESAMSGVAIGAAMTGCRTILSHQRLDFAMLAMDQMVTQAAKWHYMFGGKMKAPVVYRMVLGRGWGQGPQHSQSLQSWFAHIPGLKVIMPVTPHDAKGLTIAAIRDENPVILLEHRWLHNISGEVPEGDYEVAIGPVRKAREGKHVTIVAFTYMVLEAIRAAEKLAEDGIEAEVIDIHSLRPLDHDGLLTSLRKTGHLAVIDSAWTSAGMSAEIVALAAEAGVLKAPPKRLGFPECPTPTSRALAAGYHPRAGQLCVAIREMLGKPAKASDLQIEPGVELDKPDPSFTGPF